MAEERNFKEAFKNSKELYECIPSLLDNGFDLKLLCSVSEYTCFASSLSSIKIPAGYILKIYNILHNNQTSSFSCRRQTHEQVPVVPQSSEQSLSDNVSDRVVATDLSDRFFKKGNGLFKTINKA